MSTKTYAERNKLYAREEKDDDDDGDDDDDDKDDDVDDINDSNKRKSCEKGGTKRQEETKEEKYHFLGIH